MTKINDTGTALGKTCTVTATHEKRGKIAGLTVRFEDGSEKKIHPVAFSPAAQFAPAESWGKIIGERNRDFYGDVRRMSARW